MWPLGLSTCGDKPLTEEMFCEYQKSGVKCIELSYRRFTDIDFEAAKALADKYEVTLWSLHLPFLPFAEIDVSALEQEKRDRTVAVYGDIIKKAAAVGIDKFIVHPSAEIHDYDGVTPSIRKQKLAYAKETLSRLADIAEPLGAVICVEDLPRYCLGNGWEEMAALTEDERLRICFDTNHIFKENPLLLVEHLGEKIVTLHVSDYDFGNERHWLPGEGQLDFAALVALLKKANYCGPWLYEISFAAPESICRPRDLTCADFKRNSDEVQQGLPITVISTPVADLPRFEYKD